MAMPASGSPISFSQMQTEFGGSNPIGFNEYYLNGSYVPLFYEPAYSLGVNSVRKRTQTTVDDIWEWHFDSTLVYSAAPNASGIVTVSGVAYQLGTGQADVEGTSKIGGALPFVDHLDENWSIQKTIVANINIPTSGTISLSQFYGTSITTS
jgi:hypothetical protein